MIPVRQSTAVELPVGPVLDADGVAVTGCVVGDFKIKKTTGNFAALNGSATLTHVSVGVYDLVLTTSDVDTVGDCTIAIDDTTNLCPLMRMKVIEEAVYDSLFAASANGVPDTLLGYVQLMLRSDAAIATDRATQLGHINANQGSGAGSFDNTASPTVTLADGVTHGGTTAKLRLGSTSTTPAFYCTNSAGNAVGFECSSGSHTGFRISNTSSGPGMYVTSNSSTGVIFESTSGVAFGCAGATADIDANEITAIKTKTDYLPSATAGAAGGVMIAGSNAATTFATLTVSGTTTLSGAVSLGSTLTVTGATSLAALSTSGTVTFNALTVSNALIISGTSTLTGAVSLGSTLGVTGAVTFSNGLASNVTGNITGNLSGTIGSLAAQAKTDVNTEVLDVLNTDTFAEPGQGTPSATLSLASKLGYLFKAWRNRSSQTSTTYSLYNDDATTVDQKSTVSDNGTTYEHGEVTTGP